jgi:hypothetical protein
MDRPGPSLRKRFRKGREEVDGGDVFDLAYLPDALDGLGGVGVAIGLVVLTILLIFVLLPLIGVALELIAVFFLFASGLFGRLLLGRPWIVEARNLDDGERSVAYGVKGFRRAGEAVERLATELEIDGPPDRLAAGERTILPRPGI